MGGSHKLKAFMLQFFYSLESMLRRTFLLLLIFDFHIFVLRDRRVCNHIKGKEKMFELFVKSIEKKVEIMR